MNLKESFTLQNTFTNIITELYLSLTNKDSLYTITETHLRNKTNKEEEDFSEIKETDAVPIDELIKIHRVIAGEKIKLSVAIAHAKSAHAPLLDAQIADNSIRHDFVRQLNSIIETCPRKQNEKVKETGYKFNVEGNQVSYNYDKLIEYKPKLNLKEAKQLLEKERVEADNISNEIETSLLNVKVLYENEYDFNSYDNVSTALEKIKTFEMLS